MIWKILITTEVFHQTSYHHRWNTKHCAPNVAIWKGHHLVRLKHCPQVQHLELDCTCIIKFCTQYTLYFLLRFSHHLCFCTAVTTVNKIRCLCQCSVSHLWIGNGLLYTFSSWVNNYEKLCVSAYCLFTVTPTLQTVFWCIFSTAWKI
jgi:hypothetical protein